MTGEGKMPIPADTQLPEELAEDGVIEMANLTTAQTGVLGTILISTAMGRLVEESETTDFAAVEERHRARAPLSPGRVGLVHGPMKVHDKDHAMAGFAGGEIDLIVATTVIEVGVDVRDATV